MQPSKPFPLTAFPPILREFIREASASIGCHPGYVALPLLANLAAVIGNKRVIRLKRDWTEPAVIWGAIIAERGEHKSPARRVVKQFLDRDEDEDELKYISDDATFAGFRDCLADQADSRMLLMPDELAEILYSLGRGSQSMKKGHWLSCWSAEALRVHRGNKKPLKIPRAAVSIVGGIQPATFKDAILKERHLQDGLCARFLLTYQTQAQPVKWTNKRILLKTKRQMQQLFNRLLALPSDEETDKKHVRPRPIDFANGFTKQIWVDFYNRHNRQTYRLKDKDPDLAAAYVKLGAYAARIALIFQMVHSARKKSSSGQRVVISAVALTEAIELVEWFKSEATKVYALLKETPAETERRSLVELIHRNHGNVTARELMRKSSRYNTEQKATAALTDLAQHKLAKWRTVPAGKQGGRPTRRLVLATKPTKLKTTIRPARKKPRRRPK
ncbi:MAG: DUF3987 domain-containing protein [Pirellulales bacterium]